MLEVAMTPTCPDQKPAVALDQFVIASRTFIDPLTVQIFTDANSSSKSMISLICARNQRPRGKLIVDG